jgi:hypothetical protein
MFSSADLSLAAGKMRKNELVTGGFRHGFTESRAASCKQFQCHNRSFRVNTNLLVSGLALGLVYGLVGGLVGGLILRPAFWLMSVAAGLC